MKELKKFFKNKRVIVTGHTGFKGSWLSLTLHLLGAKVLGISNSIPTKPSHYELIKLEKKIVSKKINILEQQKIFEVFKKFKPDFLFHLAAQPLVKESYENPLLTWKTNSLGTINFLEILRLYNKNIVAVFITSDKAYKNLEIKRGYKENDVLAAEDPYGASKSSAEIAINSYYKSFFSKKISKILLSIARAGNVIGGGDWSKDRLIPDSMKNWIEKKPVVIRNPNSTRPWQHVIEVIYGYLVLAIKLKKTKNKTNGQAYNFGPTKKTNFRAIDLLKAIKSEIPSFSWIIKKNDTIKENKLLHLNSDKAKKHLKWKCKLSLDETIKMTTDWYKYYKKDKKTLFKFSTLQLKNYLSKLKK